MKIPFFFAISCIIANFSATSSCFSANANKDREINDSQKLNVMQSYIQKRMFSQEYDLGIQPKENNLKAYEQKGKNVNTSLINNTTGYYIKETESVDNTHTLDEVNNDTFPAESFNIPDE